MADTIWLQSIVFTIYYEIEKMELWACVTADGSFADGHPKISLKRPLKSFITESI